jgi:hypothetical protein
VQLAARWAVHPITIKRMVARDPLMPKPYRITRFETYDLAEIEAFERLKATQR